MSASVDARNSDVYELMGKLEYASKNMGNPIQANKIIQGINNIKASNEFENHPLLMIDEK